MLHPSRLLHAIIFLLMPLDVQPFSARLQGLDEEARKEGADALNEVVSFSSESATSNRMRVEL